ncbi:unnamed protein product [Linum trigynum]|uniref:Bromo domain-containing protein n=1 Tax=Linum trigynum TaxID=586398 RepID=A0AAV2CDV1_9ROSI
MGQIEKPKKKGRPSKADLARRSSSNAFLPPSGPLIRSDAGASAAGMPVHRAHARGGATAAASSLSFEDGDEDGEGKPLKKWRISGGRGGESETEADGSEDKNLGNDDEEDDNNDQEEKEADDKGLPDSVPGTPSDRLDSYPLPDKKVLYLVLHKLQKKDTCGVCSELVDLEELPNYLDVVDHPMDFATVRKKLGNSSYSTLEQFESDILLICSNVMKYNSSDTIYHKQARGIQELAQKKFEKLRVDIERSEIERKFEQKMKSNFSAKKQMKKPLSRATLEHVGSDFSSGATLANAGEVQNGPNGVLSGACERPCNMDALVEGSLSLVDNTNLEKLEELSSGKGPWPKMGKRLSVLDDNRRAIYNISSQSVERPDTIFTTFEDELEQLVAVGLHAEYS